MSSVLEIFLYDTISECKVSSKKDSKYMDRSLFLESEHKLSLLLPVMSYGCLGLFALHLIEFVLLNLLSEMHTWHLICLFLW